MFDCRVCAEKDKRINDLSAQIKTLEKLVFPSAHQKTIPILELNADGQVIETGHRTATLEEIEEIEREADSLLTGDY